MHVVKYPLPNSWIEIISIIIDRHLRDGLPKSVGCPFIMTGLSTVIVAPIVVSSSEKVSRLVERISSKC